MKLKFKRPYLWFLATAALGLGVMGTLWAQPPANGPVAPGKFAGLSPTERVVLMRSGEVFQGIVTEAGDHLIVTIPTGEISLKTADVDAICRDLAGGYQLKREQLPADAKAEPHLALALWCMRHKLYDQATEELDAARSVDPRHPKIDFLQRKMKLDRERPNVIAARQASTDKAEDEPTNADLDRFIRGMPTEAVETFAHSIQPLLLNNCTTSGCHGPNSGTGLSLIRIQLGKTPGRRLTQRNLYHVCRFVDRDNPNESPLLTQTIREHGTARAAIFTSRDMVQYKQLVGWVRQVSRAGGRAQPRHVEQDDLPLLQTVPRGDDQKLQPVDDEPLPGEDGDEGGVRQANAEAPTDRSSDRRDDGYEPVDPFDAEVFNRRYGPNR